MKIPSLQRSAAKNCLKGLAVLFLCLVSSAGYAAVTVSPATGGTNICSTVATASTTLGAINIMEGSMSDFNSGASSITIYAPSGWNFVVALPTVSALPGNDVTIGVLSITSGSFTLNFNASGLTHFDTVTITGLMVVAATASSATGDITASTAFAISGSVNGIAGANFGTLSILPAVLPLVTITASPDDTICMGALATFTPAPVGGTSPNYQWYVNGRFVGSGGTFSSGVLGTGNLVHCRMTASGCVLPASVNSNTITMTAIAAPAAVTVSGGGTFCTNATLTASNGGSGTIYFQGTTSGGMSKLLGGTPQTVTASGTYYFNATAGGGCWGTQGLVAVTVNPLVTANAGSPLTVCAGDSVSLAGAIGGGATASLWRAPSGSFTDAASLTSVYIPSIPSGMVTLTLTASGPCSSFATIVEVTVIACGMAVNDSVANGLIHVFPDPTNNVITVEAPFAVNIVMVSQVGKIVLEQRRAHAIDVSGLAQGNYVLMVYDEHYTLLRSFKIAKSE